MIACLFEMELCGVPALLFKLYCSAIHLKVEILEAGCIKIKVYFYSYDSIGTYFECHFLQFSHSNKECFVEFTVAWSVYKQRMQSIANSAFITDRSLLESVTVFFY